MDLPAVDGKQSTVRCSACGTAVSISRRKKESPVTVAGQRARVSSSGRRRGQYELIEKLGQGSYGTVWKAQDSRLNRIVALKIPRARASDTEQQARFLKEARAVAQLDHPGIVRVFEVGQWDDQPYIATEFIEGADLRVFLKANTINIAETVSLSAAMCEALHAAHEAGIIHRDIKPANIMIDRRRRPHLMDFGLAKRVANEDATMTVAGLVMGTPAYMSPEQARGDSHLVDARSDIYSLGVTLYEMLTGELPFRGRSVALLNQVIHDDPAEPRRLNTLIPIELQNVCLKCLEKQPEGRYDSAAALLEDLRAFQSHRPVSARPLTRIQRTWKWCYRNPTVASLLGLSMACLLAVCILSSAFLVRERWHGKSLQAALDRETKANDLAQKTAEELRTKNQRMVAAQEMSKAVLQQSSQAQERLAALIAASFASQLAQDLRQGRLYDCDQGFSRFRKAFRTMPTKTWETAYLKTSLDQRCTWPCSLNATVRAVWTTDDEEVLVALDQQGRLLQVKLTAEYPNAQPLSLPNVETIQFASLSKDGTTRVVVSQDSTIDLYGEHWNRRGTIERASKHSIQQISLDDFGSRLAVADAQGVVAIYNTQTQKELARWQSDVGKEKIERLSWAPDAKTLVVATSDLIRLFDPIEGTRRNDFPFPSPVTALDWRPDSSGVVVGGRWGVTSIRLGGDPTAEPLNHTRDVRAIRAEPGGRLSVLDAAGRFTRIRLESGQSEGSLQLFDHAGHHLVGLESSDRMLAVDQWGQTCVLFPETPPLAPPRVIRHDTTVRRIAWSPDDRFLAAADWSGKCIIWDTSDFQQRHVLEACRKPYFCESAEWSPDGRTLATCNNDGSMQLWDVESGREKHEFEPIQHQLYCLAWHPTLNLIATGGPDGIVRLWDPSQKRPTHLWSAEKVIEQVRWSRDGKQLAAVGNHFYLSNLVDGRLEQEMKRWMGHMLYDVVQSPRGDSWAIANSSGEVRLWKDGRVTEPIRIASNELRSVRFSPGGISLVTCDGSGNVQFSDPSFHQSVLRLHQTGNQPRSPRAWHVAFSNDGTRLAACNAKGEIRIWSTTDTEK